VVSDGNAFEPERAFFIDRLYKRQVGSAAADVANQQHVTCADRFSPAVTFTFEPCINGCLRLFEQDQVIWEPCSRSRFARQFARACIERSGNGEHHSLLTDRIARKLLLPN